MNISREQNGSLGAFVKIDLSPADYAENVTKSLKSHQQKANIKGFRPGKVPFALVEKMYKKPILIDEINKILSDSLMKYVEDEKIAILGNPIPAAEKENQADFDKPNNFTFWFELGLAPEFEVDLKKISLKKYDIEVSDKMLDEYTENVRRRFGKAKTEAKEGETPEIELAELNEDLFKQVYPQDDIKTEADFRKRLHKEYTDYYTKEADRKFTADAINAVVKATQIEMPNDFLKRWLLNSNEENKLTPEILEKEYNHYAESLQWQLIESKIIKDFNIGVGMEDVRQFYKENVLAQYFPLDGDEETQKRLDMVVDSMLQNQEEVKRVYEMLFEAKMAEIFKENIKSKAQKISFEDFIELVKKENEEKKKTSK